jgi:glycosyltransferase involved in cell wall biosynthesis
LIGDDASTDHTSECILKWQEQYPHRIKYFRREKNVGLHKNYADLIKNTKGQYIALLEADDYWLHPEKCVTQIDLMEKNPLIAWTFTNGIWVNEREEMIKVVHHETPLVFDLAYYVKHFFNPLNNSIVFRKTCEPTEYPDIFFQLRQWDTFLHYSRSLKGQIGFVPIEGVAWRRHPQAVSFSAVFSGPQRYFDWMRLNKALKPLVPSHDHKYLSNYPAYKALSLCYFHNRQFPLFLKFLMRMLVNHPIDSLKDLRSYVWKIRHKDI